MPKKQTSKPSKPGKRPVRSRQYNPDGATTLNILCLQTEKDRWAEAAAKQAADAGLESIATSTWARNKLNNIADKILAG